MPVGQPGLSKTKGNLTFGVNIKAAKLEGHCSQGFCDLSWCQQPVRSSIPRQAAPVAVPLTAGRPFIATQVSMQAFLAEYWGPGRWCIVLPIE